MKIIELLQWKKRPLIYSLLLSIGFGIIIYVFENDQPEIYPYLVIILSLIFILELFTTIYFGRRALKQFNLPEIIEKDKSANFIQHIVLPISLFISLTLFMFFHKYLIFKGIFIFLSLFLFWVLFSNIRAYYEDKFKIELGTHYIYDVISILSFFGLIDSLLNISIYWNINSFLTIIIICALLLIFTFIIIVRLYHYDLLKFTIPLLILNVGIYIFSSNLGLEVIRIAFLSTITYYFFVAFANHHKDRTNTYKVFEEYLIVFLIAIVFLVFN